MDVTRTIRTSGGPFAAIALSHALREEGVRVGRVPGASSEPQNDLAAQLSADVQNLMVSLTAVGTVAAIKVAVAKYRKRFPHREVAIEDEDPGAERTPADQPPPKGTSSSHDG
jgi:hypothetical protein